MYCLGVDSVQGEIERDRCVVEDKKLGTYNINLAFGGMYPGNPLDEEFVSDCVFQNLSDNLPVTCILKAWTAAGARVPQHI
jgi:hypothetical protein